MKVLIEEYRGFEIYFDNMNEVFYSVSDKNDTELKKSSYSASKKAIDDYIKNNQKFKPFYCCDSRYFIRKEKIKIVGIRKDGLLVFENSKSEKQALPCYRVEELICYNQDNDKIFEEQEIIQKEIELLRGKIKHLDEKVIKKPISELVKEMGFTLKER